MKYKAELKIKDDMLQASGANVSQAEFDAIMVPLCVFSQLELDRLGELVSSISSYKWRESLLSCINDRLPL